jgi:hypothetical protein
VMRRMPRITVSNAAPRMATMTAAAMGLAADPGRGGSADWESEPEPAEPRAAP